MKPRAQHHGVMDQGLGLVTVLITIAVRIRKLGSFIITSLSVSFFVIISDDGRQLSSTPSTDNMQVRFAASALYWEVNSDSEDRLAK